MKIGCAGSISVGKTSLVKALGELPQFQNYTIATERSKYLRDLGIKLNTDSTIEGQCIFLAERSSELMKENVITDRTLYDVCTFTALAKSIPTKQKLLFRDLTMSMIDLYDVIIYVSPEGVEIENNGVRETNAQYRNELDIFIKHLIDKHPPRKLIKVSGPTPQRIQTILTELNIP